MVKILAGAWLLMTAGLAQAADVPLKAPPLPPPAPVFNWTGLYVGADIGGAWGTSTTSSPLANNPGCFVTILPCYLPSLVADINNQSAPPEFQFGARRLRDRLQSSTRIFRGRR